MPLQDWDLPGSFATLRQLMESRMAEYSRREWVQVLRLMESVKLADLHAAVKQVPDLGVIGFDSGKHLILRLVSAGHRWKSIMVCPVGRRIAAGTLSSSRWISPRHPLLPVALSRLLSR